MQNLEELNNEFYKILNGRKGLNETQRNAIISFKNKMNIEHFRIAVNDVKNYDSKFEFSSDMLDNIMKLLSYFLKEFDYINIERLFNHIIDKAIKTSDNINTTIEYDLYSNHIRSLYIFLMKKFIIIDENLIKTFFNFRYVRLFSSIIKTPPKFDSTDIISNVRGLINHKIKSDLLVYYILISCNEDNENRLSDEFDGLHSIEKLIESTIKF